MNARPPEAYYHQEERGALLCSTCWIDRSGGDPEREAWLCLHDDYNWTQHTTALLPATAEPVCDQCGINRHGNHQEYTDAQ